jgi:hypothetical protein
VPRHLPPTATTLLALLLAAGAPVGAGDAAPAVGASFELNDAQTKGRVLAGVAVQVKRADGSLAASGTTGADGRFAARLAPGTYHVGYRLDGYVPYDSEATEIRHEGQVLTVSLSRLLEATAEGPREVRVILNWGSDPAQVRDADSHLACACGAPEGHVFYGQRDHTAGGHRVQLDVDDTDWGGPETITLGPLAPGSYLYWVHDYSGPPATLGAGDVVVRVIVGAEQKGEFRAPRGLTRRDWRPFKAIEVAANGRPTLVPFTPDEIAEAADLELPAAYRGDGPAPAASAPPGATPPEEPRRFPVAPVVAFAIVALLIIRASRRQRRRR